MSGGRNAISASCGFFKIALIFEEKGAVAEQPGKCASRRSLVNEQISFDGAMLYTRCYYVERLP
jgi:hypothetical protein